MWQNHRPWSQKKRDNLWMEQLFFISKVRLDTTSVRSCSVSVSSPLELIVSTQRVLDTDGPFNRLSKTWSSAAKEKYTMHSVSYNVQWTTSYHRIFFETLIVDERTQELIFIQLIRQRMWLHHMMSISLNNSGWKVSGVLIGTRSILKHGKNEENDRMTPIENESISSSKAFSRCFQQRVRLKLATRIPPIEPISVLTAVETSPTMSPPVSTLVNTEKRLKKELYSLETTGQQYELKTGSHLQLRTKLSGKPFGPHLRKKSRRQIQISCQRQTDNGLPRMTAALSNLYTKTNALKKMSTSTELCPFPWKVMN